MSTMANRIEQTETVIPVPEPDLTPREMIQRARDMRPLLLESQADTEARGTYSPELHEKFKEAGFYRVIQPRKYGGYEFDITVYFNVVLELAQGDPGAAWCLALGAGHSMPVASHYDEAAQAEIFGLNDGHFVAPHVATARGTITQVDGGFIIDGDWPFASGSPYSTHFLGTAHLPEPVEGLEPEIVFVIPRHDYEVLDNWGGGRVLGMQGSGSNTIRIKETFVPRNRVASWNWLGSEVPSEGTFGTALHGNPMYLGQVGALYAGELGSAQVGAAYAAIDEFERLLRTKKTQFPPIRLKQEDPEQQGVLGLALSWADTARAALIRAGEIYKEHGETWAKTGVGPAPADTMRLAGQVQTAHRLAFEVVQLVYNASGTSVTLAGQRMQKYIRDMTMVQPQRVDTINMATKRLARYYLGLDGDLLSLE